MCTHGGLKPRGMNVGSLFFLDVSMVSGGEMARDLPQRSRRIATAKKWSLVRAVALAFCNAPLNFLIFQS